MFNNRELFGTRKLPQTEERQTYTDARCTHNTRSTRSERKSRQHIIKHLVYITKKVFWKVQEKKCKSHYKGKSMSTAADFSREALKTRISVKSICFITSVSFTVSLFSFCFHDLYIDTHSSKSYNWGGSYLLQSEWNRNLTYWESEVKNMLKEKPFRFAVILNQIFIHTVSYGLRKYQIHNLLF